MPAPLSYFVLMLAYPSWDEAIVNPSHDWSDILDQIEDAASEGQQVAFVHHVRDGRAIDRTEDACWAVCHRLGENAEPLTDAQWKWIELHCGMKAASAFGRVAA